MATRKTGPVKPPVLDMEARKTTANAQTGAADKKSAPKSPLWQTLPLVPAAAGLAGAILGFALAYFVAFAGFWPQPAPLPDTSSAEIARLSADIEILTAAQSALKTDLATTQQALTDKSAQIQIQLDQNSDSVTKTATVVENLLATPTPVGVDSAQLETFRAELNTRINAITAGASPDLADQLAAELKATTQTLTDLSARLAAVETARLAAPTPTDTPPQLTAQLPLALAGFEAALRDGRPFDLELAAITTNLPNLTVPIDLSQNAKTGLTPPTTISQAFNAAIPDMLGAIPPKSDATLQERLMEQARSLLALRRVGAVTGDSPEALIARLETALAVPDFASAQTLMTALPQTMREFLPTIAAEIGAHVQANTFLNSVRSAALIPAESNAPTAQEPTQ